VTAPTLTMLGVKKHSWLPHRTWKLWQKPARQCSRCGAILRFESVGPRKGKRYSYRGPGKRTFVLVDKLPECQREASVVAPAELYDAATR